MNDAGPFSSYVLRCMITLVEREDRQVRDNPARSEAVVVKEEEDEAEEIELGCVRLPLSPLCAHCVG
jgi:hypothetical protein